jgi:uncharacterized heparinase superfamily protein
VKVPAVGRLLRTVRHIRPRQAVAQLRHLLAGRVVPVRLDEDPPDACASSVTVPFLPPPRHAYFDGGRHLRLLNREVEFEPQIDWDWLGGGPLFAYHLHQFDYARHRSLAPRERTAVILDWIDSHRSGVGWDPHPTSLRILSWGKLLLTEGSLDLNERTAERLRGSLACQIETLSRHLEVRLQANHLLSNLIGVVFGGLLFKGVRADVWLGFESALCRELSRQILPDGGHEERSPMYHSLLLESLLDLLNLARAAGDRAPRSLRTQLEECAARMLGALPIWTHPDGEIALFADSALGIAPAPAALAEYATALGVEARSPASPGVLGDCGYLRLERGPFCLIASVSGPAPPHQPGHAHCDALAFELSVGGQRVVTDTGVAEYAPGALRHASRRTRGHATLEVAGREQAEIWQAHRIGGRPEVSLCRVGPGAAAEATCAGWATLDTTHRRGFSVSEGAVVVRDQLEGRPRPVRFALPLAPGLQPNLELGGDGASRVTVPLDGGARLRIALPGAGELQWRLERTPYFPEFGCQQERPCLVGEAESFGQGEWQFEL